jgi:hypothetical protein
MILLATLLALPARAQEPGSLSAMTAEYAALANKAFDENGWTKTTPDEPALIAALWHLQQRWTERWLNEHPRATGEELSKALQQLHQDFTATALVLAPNTYLVGTGDQQVGTFFIVSQREGKFATVWSIENNVATEPAAGNSSLQPWIAATNRPCVTEPVPANCTQLWPSGVRLLQPTADRKLRFAVEANYLQLMGATVRQQLSVWSWDGTAATAQFAGEYSRYLDQGIMTRFEGSLIRIRYKDFWKALSACGSCEGDQRDWTLKLTATGVKDLGRKTLVPELEVADRLFDAVLHDRDASQVGSAKALAVVRRELPGPGASVGMMMEWSLARGASSSDLCIHTDGMARLNFTLIPRDGHLFVTAAKRAEDGGGCVREGRIWGI